MNLELFKKNNKFDVEVLSKSFLEYIDVSEETINTYKKSLKQFANYLKENSIKTPTRDDIIRYREYLKEEHKPTTVNAYLIAVRCFFDYLEYEGIYKNIAGNVKNIRLEQRHLKRGLSVEEVKKVLCKCKDIKETLMVKLMVSCGLRSNELINIKVEDFVNDGGTIMLCVLGKGRNGIKQDQVKIDSRLFEDIKNYVVDNNITNYLFTSNSNNNRGGQLSTKTIRRTMKKLFEDSDLDNLDMLSAHSLRHTSCDLALQSGMSIQEVSENLRHKSITTTMIYKNELDKKNSEFANTLCDLLYEKESEV